MQFGFFNGTTNEYIITRPDTPKSWSNYLGSTEYGAIITNNAGGYSFYRSGGMGRILRMRFNSIPMDQPGRYIYFHDHDNQDFWSASWQPVGKALDDYKSTCRHGTGYTIITSEYADIESEVSYFVPIGQLYEVWKVRVTNKSNRQRKLSAFTYTELVGNWNAIDDLLNIQYVQYTTTMKVFDGIIDHGTNIYLPEDPTHFKNKDQGRHTFQALVGVEVNGYDTDRETFLGPYRSYANPIAVENGACANSPGYGDNPCGSLQTSLTIEPGESQEFLVIMGIGKADIEGKKAVRAYSDISKADAELQKVKKFWHNRIKGLSAATPDSELNSTINTWGIYNALITFAWSRAASLVYSGIDRDGLGYRDTLQDFLGVLHTIPDEACERLELMITGQVSTGGAMPVVLPISHTPGQEKAPSEEQYRSDDCMWLFNAVPAYVKETGDIEFYHKVLPYADKGEDSVFGHLKRAIQFNLERSGSHGLPCGLAADWNDCLRFGHNGETAFVAMQLRFALKTYVDIARLLENEAEAHWATPLLEQLDKNIQEHVWDGDWFLRGYRFDGLKFGSKESAEGQIFLNPQAWSIISGAASNDQAESAMHHVKDRLATAYGIAVCDPPYTVTDHTIARASFMNPGLKENGGIFVHTQGWAVIAEAMLGHGNQAYEYLRAYLPAAYNTKADIREIEPYVVCQSTHAKYSPRHGASRIPWLSGSATWTYYAISQYILGIQPEYDGLRINPCIPSQWDGFSATRIFRGKIFEIDVTNPDHVEKGVRSLEFNGRHLDSNFITAELFGETNIVKIVLG